MSFNDNDLSCLGIEHPSETRKTDFVLYPEMPLVAAVVFPRPLLT